MGFLSDSDSKEYAYNAGDLGLISGPVRCPGEGNTESSILAWAIPWTEKPVGPQFMGFDESNTTD